MSPVAAIPLLLLLVASALPAGAANSSNADQPAVTFTRDVQPILQANCQQCHHSFALGVSGMVAPMALTTYDEVRPYAKAIAQQVSARTMPRWDADVRYQGVFKNERFLEQNEIDQLVEWARSGAPAGRPEDAPPDREWRQQTWWLGEPDLVVRLPKQVWVGDEVADWQPTIAIELSADQLPEDRWLRAVECLPGSDVVHHMVVYATNNGERDRGLSGAGGNIGGLAPGAEPELAEPGYGILLRRGSTLQVSMHYHKEPGPGTGRHDQSSIGLHFYPRDAAVRNTQIAPIGNLDFEIPPGDQDWTVGMAQTLERPITLLSLLPHMHFRGSSARFEAFYPDGRREMLLEVPRYNYAWQHNYRFAQPRNLPAGTRIEVQMTFDNSPANPRNPDPRQAIRFGAPTTDEMALGWMYWAFDDETASPAATYREGAAPAPPASGGR